MEIATGEGQIQIHLISKQEQYAIPDTPLSIGANIKTDELNTLVNQLLQDADVSLKAIEFDFLISGEFVRSRLGDHLRERSVSFEDTIHIEYVERYPAPEPQDCLLHDDWVSAVQTRDKYILTGCYDNTVNIWTTNGAHTLSIPGHEAPVKSVAWISLDAQYGTFVSSSQDQTAMLWQWDIAANTVRCAFVCKGHERGVDAVAVNGAGKLMATGSWDKMLKVWSADSRAQDTDANSGNGDAAADDVGPANSKRPRTAEQQTAGSSVSRTRTPLMTLQGHREAVSAVEWMADDMVLTGSWDHTLKIWDLSLEGVKAEICGNKAFFDISYSPRNGLIVTGSADQNVRLYDARTNHGTIMKNTYLGHSAWVQSVCWSKTEDNLFISGSYDNQVKLWDLRSPKAPLYDLTGHEDKVHACDWTNPKYMVSGGSDNTVRVFKSRKAFEKA